MVQEDAEAVPVRKRRRLLERPPRLQEVERPLLFRADVEASPRSMRLAVGLGLKTTASERAARARGRGGLGGGHGGIEGRRGYGPSPGQAESGVRRTYVGTLDSS